MTESDQPYMTGEELQRYVDGRIAASAALRSNAVVVPPQSQRTLLQRLWGLISSLLWVSLIGIVITVFAFAAKVQYGLPIPLPDSLVGTAAVTFSTAAAPQEHRPTNAPAQQQPFIGSGAPPWPTLTPTEREETATAVEAPTAPTPNLAPSGPSSNPGFSCGVEPGMSDPNATCEDTRPDDTQSSSIPKRGPLHVGEKLSDKAGPQEGGD